MKCIQIHQPSCQHQRSSRMQTSHLSWSIKESKVWSMPLLKVMVSLPNVGIPYGS